MFENFKVFETELAGRPLVIETGKMCGLSNGSCLVRYGETAVLCNATMSEKPRDGIDFLPLSVDFEEKLYAVGKIPGSFLKREGRPTEKAILTSRVVDRPIRPLFPKDLRNDVSIVMTVMSVDPDCSPEISGMIGASIALSISNIPWNGPIAGVSVGLVDGQPVLNPTAAQREVSQMAVTVAGTAQKVNMIEAGAKEVDEETMLNAILVAHEEIKKVIKFIDGIVAEIGKPKMAFESAEVDHDMFEAIREMAEKDVMFALDTNDKNVREARLFPIKEAIHAKFDEIYPDKSLMIDECIYKLQKMIVRRWLLEENKRVDGRGMDEIRPLHAEVGLLPRVHGSGMFTRGQTQVLTVATLGPVRDAQILDGIDNEDEKRYMHHYNFPSYSVGETKPSRGPGRREIGHGALAERALEPVIPSEAEFPYAYRLVSEVLSSNGSTSQASICASTLALMDAGVPIKAPVAGISCGLITAPDGSFKTMVDIQGLEDFFGDMDFKVGGTHKGITAIQMDLKIDGLTTEIIREAFEKTRKARLYILDEIMLKALPAPRENVSKYAPKMLSMKIEVDKIREVIGSGGKVIQKLCAECDVKIDIEDDGSVFISGIDLENCKRAQTMIETIVFDPEIGAIYTGKVTRLMQFGAFVEIAPGKEGLVHISKLDAKRVEKVEDVVKEGDTILVKVTEIDDRGRINLSRKDAIADIEARKNR
ncbi:MAG: polyribonucleotide nucleotidyltransferase [Oscillospiraceae bacterium]|nr:polyribonucleotide nucleotidyltransferase [Oscillospiraceae bacterium]MBQ8732231.1 polyribonucleotide nucleotidyltransferase [Oscillospiraceae bacterium]